MRRDVCWIALCLAIVSASADAETFVLKDGDIVDGTVLRSLGNTLTIKSEDAGMYQLPVDDIERIEIEANDGTTVTGSLAWWADGMYVVVTRQGLVEVKDGIVTKVSEGAPASPAPAEPVQADIDEEAAAPVHDAPPSSAEQLLRKLEPTM